MKSFSSTLVGARSGSAFALAVASSCALRHAFLLVPSLRACGLQDFPCSDLTPGPCLGMSGLRVGAPAEGPPPLCCAAPPTPVFGDTSRVSGPCQGVANALIGQQALRLTPGFPSTAVLKVWEVASFGRRRDGAGLLGCWACQYFDVIGGVYLPLPTRSTSFETAPAVNLAPVLCELHDRQSMLVASPAPPAPAPSRESPLGGQKRPFEITVGCKPWCLWETKAASLLPRSFRFPPDF